jgi:hypothetical protein
MNVEKIIGIELNGKILSEKRFDEYGISSVEDALSQYFEKYGYKYTCVFDLEEDLLIFQNMNPELQGLLNSRNLFDVVNYKTGEVYINRLDVSDVYTYIRKKRPFIVNSSYQIFVEEEKYHLFDIRNNTTILQADDMLMISSSTLVYKKHGIYSILDLKTGYKFPVIKKESKMYYRNEPEHFIDMRNGMFYKTDSVFTPIYINNVDLDSLTNYFTYGQKNGKTFHLLDEPIFYGITITDENNTKDLWYSKEEEREEVITQIAETTNLIFEKEKAKQKSITILD